MKFIVAGVGVASVLSGSVLGLLTLNAKDDPEPAAPHVDGTRTRVVDMPKDFRDIAFTCHGPNGLYVTEHQGSQSSTAIAVIENDPLCVR